MQRAEVQNGVDENSGATDYPARCFLVRIFLKSAQLMRPQEASLGP